MYPSSEPTMQAFGTAGDGSRSPSFQSIQPPNVMMQPPLDHTNTMLQPPLQQPQQLPFPSTQLPSATPDPVARLQQQQQYAAAQQQPHTAQLPPFRPFTPGPSGMTPTSPPLPQQQLQQQQQQQQYQLQQQRQYQQHQEALMAQMQTRFQGPPVFTLDQLPPPETHPVVALTEHQANDVMQALAEQGGAFPRPEAVDLLDAQNNFLDSLSVKRMTYIHTVELATPNKRFKHHGKPSLLQCKNKDKRNRLADIVQPALEPGNQGFLDLSYAADGTLLEDGAQSWQFGLTLLKAESVGKTGLRGIRTPFKHIARIGIFDRSSNRFLGNTMGFLPQDVRNRGTMWEWEPRNLVVVRCSCMQEDPRTGSRLVDHENLSLYVELNVAYRLDKDDIENMPPSETKAAQMVDEITCAWTMISFSKCKEMTKQKEVAIPLYYGSIYAPKHLEQLYKELKKTKPLGGVFHGKAAPVLVFSAGPLPADPPPLVPYALYPPTMLGYRDTGTALAVYRACLAQQLAKQNSVFAPISDVVLSSFGAIVADNDLFNEFTAKWKYMCGALAKKEGMCRPDVIYPTLPTLMDAFRRCVSELSPLLHSPSLPVPHIANFAEYKDHRMRVIHRFAHPVEDVNKKVPRHPVEPLSHAGFEFLHEPFDVAELRFAPAAKLSQP